MRGWRLVVPRQLLALAAVDGHGHDREAALVAVGDVEGPRPRGEAQRHARGADPGELGQLPPAARGLAEEELAAGLLVPGPGDARQPVLVGEEARLRHRSAHDQVLHAGDGVHPVERDHPVAHLGEAPRLHQRGGSAAPQPVHHRPPGRLALALADVRAGLHPPGPVPEDHRAAAGVDAQGQDLPEEHGASQGPVLLRQLHQHPRVARPADAPHADVALRLEGAGELPVGEVHHPQRPPALHQHHRRQVPARGREPRVHHLGVPGERRQPCWRVGRRGLRGGGRSRPEQGKERDECSASARRRVHGVPPGPGRAGQEEDTRPVARRARRPR